MTEPDKDVGEITPDEADFLERIEQARPDAEAAETILSSDMVRAYFESSIYSCFEEFAGLPENATLDQYRATHLRAKSIMDLRTMLKNKISISQRLKEGLERMQELKDKEF